MRVLITGNMGYVGSVLIKYLKKEYEDIRIVGLDTGFFSHSLTGTDFLPEILTEKQVFKDIREISKEDIVGVDSIIHLSAISNDPMGMEFEEVTEDINQKASINLAKLAVKEGVKNFVFASSCSMYGSSEMKNPKTELDITNPLTAYARSKINTEEELSRLDSKETIITCLRFATACGFSDRFRMDLVLNDFVTCALTSNKITILSDGSPWRPLIDVKDMSRAIAWAMQRSILNGGKFRSINIGSETNTFQVKELADIVSRLIPNTTISLNTEAPPDKRSYKVDFSLFKELAPNYQPKVKIEKSVFEIINGVKKMNFRDKDFRLSGYMRLNAIKILLSKKLINSELYWVK